MFDKCKLPAMLLSLTGLFGLTAFAQGPSSGSVVPGTVNYVEGSVSLDGQPLTSASVGSAAVAENDVLSTAQGRAEVLLTPGVFLRLGDNSAVRMISPNLTDTSVALLNGKATVEVAELFKENRIQVGVNGIPTTLLKRGLYEFNATQPQVAVYDGEAAVLSGDRQIKVKKGHEADLTGLVHVAKFDRKTQQDQLYAWSNLRSEYEAQASAESAQNIFVGGGPGWYGAGWYWNPYFDMYGFLPGDGMLYSPFGWPFYSPAFAYYYAPGYFGRGGFARGGFVGGHRGFAGRVPSSGFSRGLAAPRMGGGFAGRGMGGFGGGHVGGFGGGGFGGGHMGGGFAGGGHR
jgi:hypothetical protein